MKRSERDWQIKNAAKKCFIYKGFKETGMRDIAQEAGVALGTLYSYYRNKQELFDAIGMPELAEYRPQYERDKKSIYLTAVDLFSSKGFDNVTMGEIAASCKISRATLYQFFKNKENLFEQMVHETYMVTYTDSLIKRDTLLPLEVILSDVAHAYFQIANDKNQLTIYREITQNSKKFPKLLSIYYDLNMAGPCMNLAEYVARYCHDHGHDIYDMEQVRQRTSIFVAAMQNWFLTSYVLEGIKHKQDENSFIESSIDVYMCWLRVKGYVN